MRLNIRKLVFENQKLNVCRKNKYISVFQNFTNFNNLQIAQ